MGGGGGGNVDTAAWGTAGKVVDIKSAGFGFIRPHTGKVDDKDLHFHVSAMARGCDFNDLQIDDEVTYNVVVDDRNNKASAKQVSIVGGGGKKGRDSRSPSRRR